MLFLYRPRQTWLPINVPSNMTVQQQRAYNLQMQDRFAATRRVEPAAPASEGRDPLDALQRLGDMHAAGTLTDAEFATAKAKVLGTSEPA